MARYSNFNQTQLICLVLALLSFVQVFAVPLVDRDMEKKSNLNEFMSAMKGAGRLRYGKRSLDAMTEEGDNMQFYPYYFPPRATFTKRLAQNLPELIDNLNGAERLRFGRK